MHIRWNVDVFVQLVPPLVVTGFLVHDRLLLHPLPGLLTLTATAGLPESVFFEALVVPELMLQLAEIEIRCGPVDEYS